MIKRVFVAKWLLMALLLAFGFLVPAGAQDGVKQKSFDFSKIKPIVHLFANAEYNPSAGIDKDYSFWLGRVMFGFQYQYDKHWSGTILIDRTRLTGSANSMYVKIASLRWAPNDRFAMEGGVVKQFDYVPFETFWGYRFIAETFQDRYFTIPSSDLGVIAFYRVGKKVSIDLALTNGEGPRQDQDPAGKLKLGAGLNFNPTDRIQTRVFYHLKTSGEPGLTAREQLFNAFAGYRNGDRYRFGAEFTYSGGYACVPGVRSYGGTAFGVVRLHKALDFLVRYDRVFVSGTGYAPVTLPVSGQALIGGFLLSPVQGISLALNYQGFFAENEGTPLVHRFLFSFEYKI